MSSDHSSASAGHAASDDHGHGSHHGTDYYVKTYVVLLVLFAVSVIGPLAEIKILTLITAFGIAGVKAFLVMRNFMHLNVEKPFVWYMLTTAVAFMVLFFAAVAPDVMSHSGSNWENVAAQAEVQRGMAAGDEGGHGAHEGDGHEGDGHDDKGHDDPHAPAGDH